MTALLSSLVVLLAVAVPGDAMEVVLAKEKRTKSPATVELEFELPEIPEGQQVRLALDARIDWPGLAGSNPWIIVGVNGTDLRGPDLLNKAVEFTMLCGMDTTWVHGVSWRILYSPDFSDAVRTLRVPFAIPDCDPYHFVWDATPYVKPGKNAVRITHLRILTEGSTLVLRDVRVAVGEPIKPAAAAAIQPAPTGPLPTYVAAGPARVSMEVQVSASGAIRVQV